MALGLSGDNCRHRRPMEAMLIAMIRSINLSRTRLARNAGSKPCRIGVNRHGVCGAREIQGWNRGNHVRPERRLIQNPEHYL